MAFWTAFDIKWNKYEMSEMYVFTCLLDIWSTSPPNSFYFIHFIHILFHVPKKFETWIMCLPALINNNNATTLFVFGEKCHNNDYLLTHFILTMLSYKQTKSWKVEENQIHS